MKSKVEWIRRAHRCFRMLSELHRLGYQELRCMPYMNSHGFRFAIAPKGYFSSRNGSVIPDVHLNSPNVIITGSKDYFGWTDTAQNDARMLADKFITRFPEMALAGKGRDWEYAGWLSEFVGFLEQGDFVPALWWEDMKGSPEAHRAIPIWVSGNENFVWEGIESLMSPHNPTFPLPPGGCGACLIESTATTEEDEETVHWGSDRYWTDAFDLYEELNASDRSVEIDLKEVQKVVFNGDGPAYKLMDAMVGIKKLESWEGYKGAPRVLLLTLARLHELSRRRRD